MIRFDLVPSIVFLGCLLFPSENSVGQEPVKPVPFQIPSIATAPEEIAALIEGGNVTFESGDRDPSREPIDGPRIAAETRYRTAYHFESHSDWNLRRGSLRIRVRFKQVRWSVSHVIWFRSPPSFDGFWDNRLVRHEFDHARISTDPRIEKLFRDRLEKLRWIRRDIAPGDSVSDSEVDAIVEETVETIFNEVQDLVTIRYRELDRITRHGVLPLPVDGPFELQLLESPVDR